MRFLNQEDRINVAKVIDIDIVDISEDTTTFAIKFEFDLIATIASNVEHVYLYVDTSTDESLETFLKFLNRTKEDFANDSEYINHLNTLKTSYSEINDIIEFERAKPHKYKMIPGAAFSPLADISDELKQSFLGIHQLEKAQQQNVVAGGAIQAAVSELKLPVEIDIKPNNALANIVGNKNQQQNQNINQVNADLSIARDGVEAKARENDVDLVARNDIQQARAKMVNNSQPWSEAFRQNRHQSARDKMFGNVDQNRPYKNPGPSPLIEQSDPPLTIHDAGGSFSLVNQQVTKREIVRTFTIANSSIPTGFFDLKCVVCSHGINFAQQIIINRVEQNKLLNEFLDNLPPPTVVGDSSETAVTLNIYYDINYNYIGNITAVDGYRILRKIICQDNEHLFIIDVTLDKDEITERFQFARHALDLTNQNLRLAHKIFVDEILLSTPAEYRIIPLNRKRLTNGVFTDIIIQPAPGIMRSLYQTNQFTCSITSLDETTIDAIVRENSVLITLNRIDTQYKFIEIYRRDLTLNNNDRITIDTILIKDLKLKSLNIVDRDIIENHHYEYSAALLDELGNRIFVHNSQTIFIRPKIISNNLKAEIANIKIDNDVIKFDINSQFKESSIKAELAKNVLDGIKANNLMNVFEDKVKGQALVENIGRVAMHKVSRINKATNQVEKVVLVANNKFEENVKELDKNVDYAYKVESAIVDVNNVIDGISDPSKIKLLDEEINAYNGSIPKDNSNRQISMNEIIEKSVAAEVQAVEIPKQQTIVQLISLNSEFVKNKILIDWVTENRENVDFFHIERQQNNLPFESMGTTIEERYRDILSRELLRSRLNYKVTPVLLDGTLSESRTVQAQ